MLWFLKFNLGMKLYMFRTVPLSIIGVFHCTHSNGICHTALLTACEQDQDGTAVPSWSCLQAVSKTLWHTPLLCVQRKTLDDGQRNCPKHVEFYSKNKSEKLVHLVGFIIRKIHVVEWTAKSCCWLADGNRTVPLQSCWKVSCVPLWP